MLVFAADLEEIEEIGCGGVDGDKVLVRGRFGGGEGGDGEFLWTLSWGLLRDGEGTGGELGLPLGILSLGFHAWWMKDCF